MPVDGKMQALVLCDAERLEVREVPIPKATPANLLLRVAAVGLCGTDFHLYAGHANYNLDASGRPIPLREQPQVLGHEIVGVVEEVGHDVKGVRRDDAVILDQGLNCHSQQKAPLCEYCATGNSHQCEHYAEHGITGLAGGFSDYLSIPAVNTVRIESNLDFAEAAVAEPLGCVIHASDMVKRSGGHDSRYSLDPGGLQPVRCIVICGAGPAGLLFIQYLRNVIQYEGILISCDYNAKKLELASTLGATAVDPQADNIFEVVNELTGGRRAELVIDAAGSAEFFTQIPGILRPQGTVVLYGHGHKGVDLGVMNRVQYLEPVLLAPIGASGGFGPDQRPETYRYALSLLETGRIKVASLITHRYTSLADVAKAFAGEHESADYIKGVATAV